MRAVLQRIEKPLKYEPPQPAQGNRVDFIFDFDEHGRLVADDAIIRNVEPDRGSRETRE